jgi:cytochrome bd-type quinol oxidase subunit 1
LPLSKVMLALFGIGVITGTVLSFEMGMLWPNFTGTFGGVFGVGFAIEVFSFFAGCVLLSAAEAGWAHAVGVVCLSGFILLAFGAIVVPALDEQEATS